MISNKERGENKNMKKFLLGSSLVIVGGAISYRPLTAFESNVTVINGAKSSKICPVTGKEYITVETDKEDFIISSEFLEKHNKDTTFINGELYHVIGHGVNFPLLHLKKRVTRHIGTPCIDYPFDNSHCAERPSLISKVSKFF